MNNYEEVTHRSLILQTLYLFAAIALVVNDYFIASLQRLSAVSDFHLLAVCLSDNN